MQIESLKCFLTQMRITGQSTTNMPIMHPRMAERAVVSINKAVLANNPNAAPKCSNRKFPFVYKINPKKRLGNIAR